MNNRQRLIELITEFKLDRLAVSEMLKVKRDTVDHWLMSTESKSHEEIPDMAIELLEMKLDVYQEQEQNKSVMDI